jgi:hypothetical protein
MRRTGQLLATACIFTLLPACALQQLAGFETSEEGGSLDAPEGYRAELHPGVWALERVSRSGTVIWIRSAESGCYEFHHAEVREVAGGVRVETFDRVLIPVKPNYGCLLPLFATRHRVALPRPLGNDRIFGACAPGDATGDQRICAAMHRAARRSLEQEED